MTVEFDTEHYADEDNSLFAWMERKYNGFLKSIGLRAADTAWKASFTGIGKGLLLAFGGMVLAGVIGGGFMGHAAVADPTNVNLNGFGVGLGNGMLNGAIAGVGAALTWGLPILAIGAAAGAVSDIRGFHFEHEAQQAAARQAQRTRGPAPDIEPEPPAPQPPSRGQFMHDVDVSPPAEWYQTRIRRGNDPTPGGHSR